VGNRSIPAHSDDRRYHAESGLLVRDVRFVRPVRWPPFVRSIHDTLQIASLPSSADLRSLEIHREEPPRGLDEVSEPSMCGQSLYNDLLTRTAYTRSMRPTNGSFHKE
jgi:hypothetical protein